MHITSNDHTSTALFQSQGLNSTHSKHEGTRSLSLMIGLMASMNFDDEDMSLHSSSQSSSMSTSTRSSFESVAPPQLSLLSSTTSVSKKPFLRRWSMDPNWAALYGRLDPIGPGNFKLLRRIGRGDIGTVYVCQLRDDQHECRKNNGNPLIYAMKVVDKRELEEKKKISRAEVERKVLRSLDHPFLPTLYAEFDASPHYSCVVMDFCSGGDLHSLRHRQPNKRFDHQSTRFYASEVLIAIEYLHMLGIVYRDLKPENVLIRSDGHIMLSDFDLSLQSSSSPTLQTSIPPSKSRSSSSSSCLPSFFPFFSKKNHQKKKNKNETTTFVAEPAEARSFSFVGTHEYVAPEVALGTAHGSGVDWWAFGVLLYELLYGRTPFVGPNNRSTIRNIVRSRLDFPEQVDVDPRAKDLIGRLLVKDPSRRFGSKRGAADLKSHPFFSGVNFALLRSQRAPFVPSDVDQSRVNVKSKTKKSSFDYF